MNELYQEQKQPFSSFPLCPYEKIFSFLYRNRPEKEKKETKILELGCGSCNNLLFAAQDGFQCCGIDIAEESLRFARALAKKRNVTLDLVCGSFANPLPWKDHSFDMIFERAAISLLPFSKTLPVVDEVYRILVPQGHFLCSLYSREHETYVANQNNAHDGYVNFPPTSVLRGYSAYCFYSEEMICKLFPSDKWTIGKISHEINQCITLGKESKTAMYWVEVQKR